MPKFHRVIESESNLTQEDLDAGKRPRVAFAPTAGDAKRLAREWNGGKALRANCGVEVKSDIVNGKQAIIDFLNEVVGYDDPNKAPPPPPKRTQKTAVKAAAKKPVKKTSKK